MRIRLEHISAFAFIAVAYLLLPAMNADYLYTIQDNSVFINGHTFMQDTVAHNGGWIAWAACYLTQFLYHPWLGSTLLIALWVTIYLLLLRLFSLKGRWTLLALIPPVLLMLNLLDYGYWIYCAKTPGFAFQPTLFVLLVVAASCLCREALRLLHLLSPNNILTSIVPLTLFTLLLALTGNGRFNNHQSELFITLGDRNFRHELKMYRALDNFEFEEVLREMESSTEAPTNLMVLYKNIALMHTGRITDMFRTNNCGVHPLTGDTLQLHTSLLGGPLIYYQFGQINNAYRWAMENSVMYGQSFRNLKLLTRCAIFNQDFDVAKKYIALLKASLYYRDWAKEREAWMQNSTRFIQSKEFQTIAPLLNDDINMLDNDEGLCEKYLLDHFSDLRYATTPLLEDVILCLSLWTEDAYSFCIHFYDYVQRHPNQPIPTLYQEGALLYGNAEASPITIDRFKFDTTVSDKYNRFAEDYNQLTQQGLETAEIGKRMKPLYGDTYWWYYYFYTDFTIY